MKEISVLEFENVRIGNAQNPEAGTGCTVVVCPEGAPAGLDVRGGGPASRETELLKPLAHADRIHAVLLSGGSAYGLDAAGGVMAYLEEHGMGLPVGDMRVPLVCQSCIFDLGVGDGRVRPDKAMGYEVCRRAFEGKGNYTDGNVGAGTGASVGKILGAGSAMKSGLGSYALQVGLLKVGAIVAVNAIGDVYDWKTGRQLAGLRGADGRGLRSTEEVLFGMYAGAMAGGPVTNTTIGIILTNGKFDKAQLCKIAGMTHNGYARVIRPVHTSMDGDSIYALSLGEVPADKDIVGTLAARVMAEAIARAVQVPGAYGLPGLGDPEK